jgi:hypothetical protein
LSSAVFTEATAVAATRRSVVVAAPVTVTPSSCSTSFSSEKFAVFSFAATRIVWRL